MIYTTNVDVMLNDRFLCTVRNVAINSLFKDWLAILIKDIMNARPSLVRHKQFDMWFHLQGETSDRHIRVVNNINKIRK